MRPGRRGGDQRDPLQPRRRDAACRVHRAVQHDRRGNRSVELVVRSRRASTCFRRGRHRGGRLLRHRRKRGAVSDPSSASLPTRVYAAASTARRRPSSFEERRRRDRGRGRLPARLPVAHGRRPDRRRPATAARFSSINPACKRAWAEAGDRHCPRRARRTACSPPMRRRAMRQVDSYLFSGGMYAAPGDTVDDHRAGDRSATACRASCLQYQVVEPGQYIEIGTPAYNTNWTTRRDARRRRRWRRPGRRRHLHGRVARLAAAAPPADPLSHHVDRHARRHRSPAPTPTIRSRTSPTTSTGKRRPGPARCSRASTAPVTYTPRLLEQPAGVSPDHHAQRPRRSRSASPTATQAG